MTGEFNGAAAGLTAAYRWLKGWEAHEGRTDPNTNTLSGAAHEALKREAVRAATTPRKPAKP